MSPPGTAAQSAGLHKPAFMTLGTVVVVEDAEGNCWERKELKETDNPLGNNFEPIPSPRDLERRK